MSLPFESVEPTPAEIAIYQASLREMFAQTDERHRKMQKTQIEIDQLKQETQVIVQETQVILDRLQAACFSR